MVWARPPRCLVSSHRRPPPPPQSASYCRYPVPPPPIGVPVWSSGIVPHYHRQQPRLQDKHSKSLSRQRNKQTPRAGRASPPPAPDAAVLTDPPAPTTATPDLIDFTSEQNLEILIGESSPVSSDSSDPFDDLIPDPAPDNEATLSAHESSNTIFEDILIEEGIGQNT